MRRRMMHVHRLIMGDQVFTMDGFRLVCVWRRYTGVHRLTHVHNVYFGHTNITTHHLTARPVSVSCPGFDLELLQWGPTAPQPTS
jgi:hypothetical protein